MVHGFLITMTISMLMPLYFAFVVASQADALSVMQGVRFWPAGHFIENISAVLIHQTLTLGDKPVWVLLLNSALMASIVALGKVLLALLAAFSLVYLEMPFKKMVFLIIFSTLVLPIEVRVLTTFQVTVSLNWLNSMSGLTIPLMASATAIFLFRQFFHTVPPELLDAAKLDGAGPIAFFWHILWPLSRAQIGGLFVILFVFGWNQYLWPLVITTSFDKASIVMGIKYLANVTDQIPQWHYIMCVALLALLPPSLMILIVSRRLEKGLIH